MTITTPTIQYSSSRERSREVIEEKHSIAIEISFKPPWKRAKSPFRSLQEANLAYWNSLSKPWLTPSALEELNRRNEKATNSVKIKFIGTSEISKIPGILANFSSQLKRLARHGGPDLDDLRGYPEPAITNSTAQAMSPSQSDPKSQSRSTNRISKSTHRPQSRSTNRISKSSAKTRQKGSSAYSHNFEQHLIDHGIHPHNWDQTPHNWDEIQQRMKQQRSSLSLSKFPDDAFKTFRRANYEALDESMVLRKVLPIIAGDSNIFSAEEKWFNNLEPLTDGTLVDPKPDFYDGARPKYIDQRILAELGSCIIPSAQHQGPASPNFFTEVKGPHGSGAVARRQACYAGVMGQRGIEKLRAFGMNKFEAVNNNKAYTITSIYHSSTGALELFTIHQIKSTDPDSSPRYYMTLLDTFVMTHTAEKFREGASAFRDARDWAEEKRNEVIKIANGKLTNMPKITSTLKSSDPKMERQPTNGSNALNSETSADKLAQDNSGQE